MSTSNVVVMQKDVEVAVEEPQAAFEVTKVTKILSWIQGLSKDWLGYEIGERVEARGTNMIQLGGLLERAATELDMSNFLQWCYDQYGLEGHQVHAYRRAYRVVAYSGLDLDELSKLDTYKLCKLLPQVVRPLPKVTLGPASPGNVETYEANQKWLDKALSMTRAELSAAIAKAKDKPAATAKQYVFKVQQDAETVDTALAQLAKDTDGHVGAAAFVDLCTAYLCGNKLPPLRAMMKQAGPDQVLTDFAELWPDWDLKATKP